MSVAQASRYGLTPEPLLDAPDIGQVLGLVPESLPREHVAKVGVPESVDAFSAAHDGGNDVRSVVPVLEDLDGTTAEFDLHAAAGGPDRSMATPQEILPNLCTGHNVEVVALLEPADAHRAAAENHVYARTIRQLKLLQHFQVLSEGRVHGTPHRTSTPSAVVGDHDELMAEKEGPIAVPSRRTAARRPG